MAKATPRPFTPQQERFGSVVIKWLSAANTWIYRLTGGRIGGKFLRGAPVMLLTTTGRTSGEPRTAPLLYLERGREIVVVASKGGMSTHPMWFRNLEANPRCEVEIRTTKQAMLSRRATEAEKAALWPSLLDMYPDFADYQARTTRDIPVVILTPA